MRIFALFLRLFNLEIRQVEGNSMVPNFNPGDKVLLKRRTSDLQPLHVGEVVMINREGEELLKRIVRYEIGGHTGQGMITVEGDNKDASIDSRHWGAVPSRLVKAKVLKVFKKRQYRK